MSDTEIRAMRYTIEQLSEKLHATEQYLRDVKKALDVAVDALKEINKNAFLTDYAQSVLDKALAKITALEQKDGDNE